jgi:trehalose/maltose transport system permease protein
VATAPTGEKKERGVLKEEFGNPERRVAYYMILPALFIILVVAFYPIGYSVYLNFFKANINNTGNFVGFQNYVLMFQNSEFIEGLKNNLIFTVASVSLEFVIGLAIALAINRAFRGRGW